MMVWALQVPPIFTDPVGTVIDAVSGEVTGAVTGAVGDVVGKVFEGLVAFLSSGVKMLLDGMTDLLGAVTDADVTEAWYRDGPYRLLASVSLSVTALLFISQVPVAALRGETGQLVRKALVTMPLAVLCIMWAPALTGRLSTLADGLTTVFGGAASEQLSDGFARLATASSVTGAAAPSLMSLVGLLLLFLSSLILWLVLMLRAAALALIVGMVPLGAAAMLHDRIKEMMPTVTKLVVVTVLAKPVIFWAMSVGAAYLAAALPGGVDTAAAPQPGSDPGLIVGGLANVSTLIVGALVMLCAAISPMALFKVIPGFDGAFSGGALGSGATSAVGAAAGVGLAGAKLAQLRGGSKGVGAGDADSGGDDSVVGEVDSGQAAQLGAAAATGGTSEAAMLGSEGGSTGGGPTGDGPAGAADRQGPGPGRVPVMGTLPETAASGPVTVVAGPWTRRRMWPGSLVTRRPAVRAAATLEATRAGPAARAPAGAAGRLSATRVAGPWTRWAMLRRWSVARPLVTVAGIVRVRLIRCWGRRVIWGARCEW
jgi:type IV secretion system protein TrbL